MRVHYFVIASYTSWGYYGGVFSQAENSPDNYEVTSYSSKCINYVIFPISIAVFHILGISMQSIEEFVAP